MDRIKRLMDGVYLWWLDGSIAILIDRQERVRGDLANLTQVREAFLLAQIQRGGA